MFQNVYSIFPALVPTVVPGPDIDSHLHVCLNYLASSFSYEVTCKEKKLMFSIRKSAMSQSMDFRIYIYRYIYSEKSISLHKCKQSPFSARESMVLVVLNFESIRVFNDLCICRVSVSVGLLLSHHLIFSDESLMRGQLLMEIRKTFTEELVRGRVCYPIMFGYKSLWH